MCVCCVSAKVTPPDINAILPPQAGDRQPENISRWLLDALLAYMVSEVSAFVCITILYMVGVSKQNSILSAHFQMRPTLPAQSLIDSLGGLLQVHLIKPSQCPSGWLDIDTDVRPQTILLSSPKFGLLVDVDMSYDLIGGHRGRKVAKMADFEVNLLRWYLNFVNKKTNGEF